MACKLKRRAGVSEIIIGVVVEQGACGCGFEDMDSCSGLGKIVILREQD